MAKIAQALFNPGQEKRFKQFGRKLWCRDRTDVEKVENLINLQGDLEKADLYLEDLNLSQEDEKVLISWCVTLAKGIQRDVARRAAQEMAAEIDVTEFIDSLGESFPGKDLLWESYRAFNDISAVYMLGYLDGARKRREAI